LMRHSTPILTAKLYIDVEPSDMIQALDQLTALSRVQLESTNESPNDSI
jgi:hypothetical protein